MKVHGRNGALDDRETDETGRAASGRALAVWTGVWAAYALAAAAVYGKAGAFPFLLDDVFHFVENATVRSWEGLSATWSTNYWEHTSQSGLYRPLLKTIWTVEIVALGGSRLAVLVVSLAFHALNATLVGVLARRAVSGWAIPVAAGLWFALHPAHSEVLVTGVGQGEIFSLSLALGMLALVFPGPGARDGKGGVARLAGFALLSCAGLLVKEQAFMASILGAAVLCANPAFTPRAKVATLAVTAGGIVATVLLRFEILGSFGPQGAFTLTGDLAPLQRLPLALYLLGRYTLLAVAPVRLAPDYCWLQFEMPIRAGHPLLWVGSATALGAAIWMAWTLRTGRRTALLCGLVAFMPLGTFLGFLPLGTLFAERHACHALAGAALLLALTVSWGAQQARRPAGAAHRRALAAGLLLLWALDLGLRAERESGNWESGLRLWEATWRKYPRNYFAAANLAHYQFMAGDRRGARRNAEAALVLEPNYGGAHLTLGELEMVEDKPLAARRHFQNAMTRPTSRLRARVGMAEVDARLGRVEEARKAYEALMSERQPGMPNLEHLAAEIERAEQRR
jgi:tetratricopeptide (TPR) repeat protein